MLREALGIVRGVFDYTAFTVVVFSETQFDNLMRLGGAAGKVPWKGIGNRGVNEAYVGSKNIHVVPCKVGNSNSGFKALSQNVGVPFHWEGTGKDLAKWKIFCFDAAEVYNSDTWGIPAVPPGAHNDLRSDAFANVRDVVDDLPRYRRTFNFILNMTVRPPETTPPINPPSIAMTGR